MPTDPPAKRRRFSFVLVVLALAAAPAAAHAQWAVTPLGFLSDTFTSPDFSPAFEIDALRRA